jgi:hypothetical protein
MKLFLSETYGLGLLILKCQIIGCRIKGLMLYDVLLWQCDVHMEVLLLLYRFPCSPAASCLTDMFTGETRFHAASSDF